MSDNQHVMLIDSGASSCILGHFKFNKKVFASAEVIDLKPVSGLSEEIDFQLKDLLNKCASSFDNLSDIICSSGPGSFTGLRTGISLAQGIAFGQNLKIFYVSRFLAAGFFLSSQLSKRTKLILRANKEEFFSSDLLPMQGSSSFTFELSEISTVNFSEISETNQHTFDIETLKSPELAQGYQQAFSNITSDLEELEPKVPSSLAKHYSIWKIGDEVTEPYYIKEPQALSLAERGIKSVLK